MSNSWQNPDHWLRAITNPWYQLILQLEETIIHTTADFYRKKRVHSILLPVTTGSISSPMGLGSDSQPVEIEINGHKTYLADSMQFLLEYGCRFFDTGCYYIMPTFRGEKVDARHLSQFFHSEVEIRGGLNDVIRLAEDYIKALIKSILKNHADDIRAVAGNTDHLKNLLDTEAFSIVTFNEAESLLHDYPNSIEYNNGFRSITPLGEQLLIKIFNGPVWLKNFDNLAVPFYQKIDPDDPHLAKNADLLMGIGETLGCGERNATANELKRQLKIHNVNPRSYDWYIQMHKYYPVQTSGFGMGIERFLLFVLKHDDIRDVQLVLRFNNQKGNNP